MASTNPTDSPAPEIGRLQAQFQSQPFSAHSQRWDQLWKESYTPWDRGEPSAALSDLLSGGQLGSSDLFSHHHHKTPKPRALVPGCGRGHDVLLLSAFGYDVTGLDVSATSLREAAENAARTGDDGVYALRGEVAGEKGAVSWVNCDFFNSEDGGGGLGKGGFDLIYDYTFFCALPPDARPKWAKRMSELLSPNGGRLVCLEWPLSKAPSAGGPPWGVTVEAYATHLGNPGVDLVYNENGLVAESVPTTPPPGALKQLGRFKPTRTFKCGYDDKGGIIDFISVWGH